jgi:hypothetical protein
MRSATLKGLQTKAYVRIPCQNGACGQPSVFLATRELPVKREEYICQPHQFIYKHLGWKVKQL